MNFPFQERGRLARYCRVGAKFGLAVCVAVTCAFAFAPPRMNAHLFAWDKADHFAAFFALMTMSLIAFPRANLALLVAMVSAGGAAIEVIQGLPGVNRDPDVWDWAAENVAIAAVLGGFVAARLRAWLAKG